MALEFRAHALCRRRVQDKTFVIVAASDGADEMRYLKRNAMKKRKQNSQASAEPSPLTTPSSTTFQLHVVRECSRMDLQHEGGPQLPRPRHAFYRHQSRTSLSKRKQNCQASPEPPFQYAIEFWRSSFARMRRVQNKTFVIVAASDGAR